MVPDILLISPHAGTDAMSRVLHQAGHRVRHSPTVTDACVALADGPADLALLDLGSGAVRERVAQLAALRSRTNAAIVLIDSGRHPELVQLLQAGANDFLAAPFSPAHLLARVTLALPATHRPKAPTLGVGGLTVDPATRRAWLDGTPLALSRREFDLLSFLCARRGEVVTRGEIAAAVWRTRPHGLEHSIDVHLSWLRRKLGETAARPRYLHTVRNVGFRLARDAATTRGSAPPA
jgi:DNA-binding response OmpR family regulator